MYRKAEDIQAKEKVAVLLRQDNGEVLKGYMFAGGQDRILDVMNSDAPFIPFETDQGHLFILRKSQVVRVEPRDDDRMGKTGDVQPLHSET